MIDDPNHPLMVAAAQALEHDVNRLLGRKRLNNNFMVRLDELVRAHRLKARGRGVDFPVLAAFVFPRLGSVELVRADLDRAGIKTQVLNMTAKHPTVTVEELAWALSKAFPHYRPDHKLQEFDSGGRVLKAALEHRV